MQDYERARVDLAALIQSLGLGVTCAFVPFSQSRNASESIPSLNWRCSVTRNSKPVTGLQDVDYMQGSGHAPASSQKNVHIRARMLAIECEQGKAERWDDGRGEHATAKRIAAPDAVDVLSSLAMDSDAIDHASYESWADDCGYDSDSRKGEAIYRACLAYALALRATIGDDKLQEIRELAHQL